MRRANLRDQVETRCALEVEATRLAAIRHTGQDIEKLNALLEQRGHSHDKTSYSQFVEHDFAFHSGVVHASHNRALAATYLFFSASVHEVLKTTLTNEIPEPDIEPLPRTIRPNPPPIPAPPH